MKRTLLGSFAGAGIGFLVPVAIGVMTGAIPHPGGGCLVFFGVFLAGTGAIAGALIGGVADLLVFFKKREEASRLQERREPESRAGKQ